MQGRFELKYIVDGETKQRFLDAVQENVSADPHGENATYRVSSLYFDTPDFRAVWEKLDGESIRRKFRLRYYSIDDDQVDAVQVSNAFMEIKHRINNTVYKQRAPLSNEGATAILTDGKELARLEDHVRDENSDEFLVNEIQRTASLQKLQSATVITYLREAWLGKIESRLRLTFDTFCQAYSPSQFAEVKNKQGTQLLDPNLAVMEVKFDQAIPCWIRDVLMKQQMRLQRFSKYASGILQDEDLQFHSQLANARTSRMLVSRDQKPVQDTVSKTDQAEMPKAPENSPSLNDAVETSGENKVPGVPLLAPLELIRRTDDTQTLS